MWKLALGADPTFLPAVATGASAQIAAVDGGQLAGATPDWRRHRGADPWRLRPDATGAASNARDSGAE